MSKLIYIDPGHGGHDPGACAGTVSEADVALDLSKRIARNIRLLSKSTDPDLDSRLHTGLTRCEDVFREIDWRPLQAIEDGADVFLSIHINSAAPAAHGSEAWISAAGYHKRVSEKIGQMILARLAAVGLKSRGIKPDTANRHGRLGVLRGFDNHGPAVLLEVGFISNEHDRKLLTNPESLEVIAVQIAAAVCKNQGIEPRMELV
jgi:N-acetylmuramoyl-L-alanine amidase